MLKRILSYLTVTTLSVTLFLSPIGNANNVSTASAKSKATYVYVVYNGQSVVYHCTASCRTLSRSKNISKVKLKVAKSEGRRKCKVCY